MQKLAELVERINNTCEDIRAEVIVSDLLASGVHIDDILIKYIGQLDRPRSQDIANAQVINNDRVRDQLQLTLNRDSIYDTLPEGLFHQPSADKRSISVSSMVEEYHRQRREEEETRQFFAPFENELFLQKTFIESEEFQQLFKIQQSQLDLSVLKKIGINPDLPRTFTSKLLRIIPYVHHITGNITQTEQLFSLLLDDPATLEIDSFSEAETSKHQPLLGQTTLGSDLIAGNQMVPDHNLFRLTVGPLSREKLPLYKGRGWKRSAIQTLINLTIPIEWDITIRIEIQREEARSFILNDGETDARLGYTTSLPQLA